MEGLRMCHFENNLGELGGWVGSWFNKKEMGSATESGIKSRWCMWRQWIACDLERVRPGCRGQGLGFPPGSQPRRHRIQRLRSALVMGNQRMGSREIRVRQPANNLVFLWRRFNVLVNVHFARTLRIS